MGFLQKLGLGPVPNGVVLDEMSLETVAELDAGGHRGDVAADDSSVWFTTHEDKALSRVDPRTRTEAARLDLPQRPLHVTADGYGPVVLCQKDAIVRVDSTGGTVVAQGSMPDGVIDVVASDGALWALRLTGDGPFEVSLLQIDPSSLAVVRAVPVTQSTYAGGLRAEGGIVSALVEDPPGSMRDAVFDVQTGEPLPDERRIKTRGIAERDGNRWLKDGDRGYKRVDLATGREVANGKAPGPDTGSSVLAHGHLWVVNFRRPRQGNADELTD